ncbi:MAG: ribose 5-phosphate isomerase A [Lachnospiraceae bacterium]|jgi:ribose 5-phosphate isomerase A|nr:ribose 5-phosphate isomerase A [Lachnospiraceae bacterium]
MNWDKNILDIIKWNGEISNLNQKQKIAEKLCKRAKNNDVIGFGSGSTSYVAMLAIVARVKEENLHITAIPTSHEIAMFCTNLNIPVASLNEVKPDWYFDGADEVNSKGWLVKGRGGAMFREKLIMSSTNERYILVDDSKFVENICDKFPIPVECTPDSLCYVKSALLKLGAESVTLRLAKGKDGPIITENGNLILDTIFRNVDENLEKEISNIVGVLESGLFIGYNVIIEK